MSHHLSFRSLLPFGILISVTSISQGFIFFLWFWVFFQIVWLHPFVVFQRHRWLCELYTPFCHAISLVEFQSYSHILSGRSVCWRLSSLFSGPLIVDLHTYFIEVIMLPHISLQKFWYCTQIRLGNPLWSYELNISRSSSPLLQSQSPHSYEITIINTYSPVFKFLKLSQVNKPSMEMFWILNY